MGPAVLLLIVIEILALALNFYFVWSLVFYHKFYYRRRLLPTFDDDFDPSIAILMPCKGIGRHFRRNVTSILRADLSNCNIYFIVESHEDPAYCVLGELTEGKDLAHVVIAGHSERNGQKNHNLLKGIEASGQRDDIYVFLDADISFSRDWIKDLVRPLSNPRVTVATGFRLLSSSRATLGEQVHTLMVACQWAWLNCFAFRGIWGGSSAIRRQDFESFGVGRAWEDTVVDDMVLSRIIRQNRGTVVVVPECIARTDETIHTVTDAFEWFKRQAAFLKYYLRPMWRTGVLLYMCTALNFVSLPCLLVYYSVHPGENVGLVMQSVGLFCFCSMLWTLLAGILAGTEHNRLLSFVLSPAHIAVTLLAGLSSGFSSTIRWSGVDYTVDRKGKVKAIRRHGCAAGKTGKPPAGSMQPPLHAAEPSVKTTV